MDFLIITLANLIWLTYTLSEGIRSAFCKYNQLLNRDKVNININKVYKIQRLLVVLTTGGIMFWSIGLYFIPFMIGQILMFRFFYRKSYDRTINYLKINDIKIKEKKKIDSKKEELVLFGITLQVLLYIFFI